MPVYEISFVQADSNPVVDGTQVNAVSTDGNNTIVESSVIGQNGAATGQGVAVFIHLTPGNSYNFIFPNGLFPSRYLTMPTTPQIILGETGPQGAPGKNAPYDLIQTFEVSNTGPVTIFTHIVARPFTLSQTNTDGSVHQAYAAYADNTQTVTFNLNKNGTSFGTLVFSDTSAFGVFDISSVTTFAIGDFLSIDFDSASDSSTVDEINMNNFIITLCAALV